MSTLYTAGVALRESLEALLITGILIGMVTRLGHPKGRKPLIYGAVAGFLVSILAGIAVIAGARELIHEGGEIMEVVAAFITVGILTYMTIWMYQHTTNLMGNLQTKTRDLLKEGRFMALAGLSFFAVLREGLETAFFAATSSATTSQIILGLILGIGAAALASLLLFKGLYKLNIRYFFAVSGVLLVAIAAKFLRSGLSHTIKDFLGYESIGGPIALVLAIAYFVGMSVFLLRPILRKQISSDEPATE